MKAKKRNRLKCYKCGKYMIKVIKETPYFYKLERMIEKIYLCLECKTEAERE